MRYTILAFGLLCSGAVLAAPPPAATTKPAPAAVSRTGEAGTSNPAVYGWQIMTPAERHEYQRRMLASKTEAERAKVSAEFHQRMAARAKARGITLPEALPPP
jgi:hypothetical protein